MDVTAARRPESGAGRRAAHAAAGPLLISICVLFALREFLVGGGLTNQHPDLLTFWLPRWSFLGRAVAAGDLPLWNPFEMAGYRFAADPQSGWLYLPPMALFASFQPGLALRLFIVFNPLLAGLGTFGFLRSEGASRVAATVGGLVLAMPIATSAIAISLPFAGAIAWTAMVLLAVSRFRRASTWSGRLGWLALAAGAWSQVAAAHLSHGLVIATAFAATLLVVGGIVDVRAGLVTGRTAAVRAVLLLVTLPVAALPILLPHVDFLGGSSLRGGYGALGDLGQTEVGDALGQEGLWAGWPWGFAAAPGAYAGAAALATAAVAARSRRLRVPALAAGGLLVLVYVVTQPLLVTAGWWRSFVLAIPFGDVYLHNPGRLRYVAVVAIPILAAAGIDGLLERPLSPRRALVWLGSVAAIVLGVPLLLGGNLVRFVPVAAGLVLLGPLLFGLATRRWTWAAGTALAGAVAVELVVSSVYSHTYEGGTIFTGLESGPHPILVPQVLRSPELSEEGYLRVTPIVEHLRREPGRYVTWAPPEASYEKGYLWMRSSADWPALAPSRGTLFGVPDGLGYNPVQLPRYWRYIRATNDLSVFYNASVLNEPSIQDVRLLGLRYLIVPAGIAPPLPARVAARADRYVLWELFEAQPPATVTDDVVPVDDVTGALETVTAAGFDPARQVVVEGRDAPGDGRGSFAIGVMDERSPTELVVRLPASARGILTLRNAYDPGWVATADGQPARTLPVDGLLQGVELPADGAREVILTYRDGAVTLGLALGAAAWLVLLGGPFVALVTERGRRATDRRRRATRLRPTTPVA